MAPRVPLPDVADSCRRFLQWCDPLLDAQEQAATKSAVDLFLQEGGPAHELQSELRKFDAAPSTYSWLDEFWKSRYLGRRDRIALNANFFFLFEPSAVGQLNRAAELTCAAANLSTPLRTISGQSRAQPGDHSEQDRRVFVTTRLPGIDQDTVSPAADRPATATSRHVVVFCRGQAFRLDVLDVHGRPFGIGEVQDRLATILKDAPQPSTPDDSIGWFTTAARAEWARNRHELIAAHPSNATHLRSIETALFCLCLDTAAPADSTRACEQLLHGDGGNRWFDKSISLVVFADGSAGINAEHSMLDGITVAEFTSRLLQWHPDQSTSSPPEDATKSCPDLRKLELVLTSSLRAKLRTAATDFRSFAARRSTRLLSFTDFGANSAKSLGISPDAFVQMAFQLAQQRARGTLGATYESISTRHFHHGRTEAMRVVTPESVRFVTLMDDPTAGVATRRAAFSAAAAAHVTRAKSCKAGLAPEQHLWELQLIAERSRSTAVPNPPIAIFDSPGWQKMRQDALSTSSVAVDGVDYFGFGPTNDQCIGIAYLLQPNRLNIHLCSARSIESDLVAFADELAAAIGELSALPVSGSTEMTREPG